VLAGPHLFAVLLALLRTLACNEIRTDASHGDDIGIVPIGPAVWRNALPDSPDSRRGCVRRVGGGPGATR
jgi:hypothetical protein